MQCTDQTRHSGHWWNAQVWNTEKGKYESKSVWCPGKVVSG